ncbi:MAG: protein-disulfide reductase DsbD domain-containing protein [Pseudomonadota bacterium]
MQLLPQIWAKLLVTMALFLGALTLSSVAWGAAGPWAENDHSRLRLIAAGDTATGPPEAPEQVQAGLHFQLSPGWKIYWRSPGDAGFPPALDWQGSQNLQSAEMSWPAPYRFSLFGLETFGYGDEVVLPLNLEKQITDQGLILQAQVNYLICEEICIPYSEDVSLALPAGSGGSSPESFLLSSFQQQVPGDGTAVGLEVSKAVLTGDMKEPLLEVTARADGAFVAPDLLVEGPPAFYFAKPDVSLSEDGQEVTFKVPSQASANAGVLEGKQLILTVLDDGRAMEQGVLARFDSAAVVQAGLAGQQPPAVGLSTLLGMLVAALLGGLILNLMPCVLPVLSIKLLSVVEQGGRAKAEVRGSFLATAAGIVFSFMVLALAAILFQQAGMAIGWGIQFQQPLFLIFMALLVVLFACNLFGFFEIPLPAWMGSVGAAGPQKGKAGAFATGAFATLLATPCSAPFLGTAVGFALSRGSWEIALIFAFLGLGLALPYLLVAAFPGLASRLPRPGAWMLTVRKVLGVFLLGTALWLLSVLFVQVGALATAVIGGLLALLTLVLWRGFAARQNSGQRSVLASPVLAGVLSLAVLAVPFGVPGHLQGSSQSATAESDAWAPLDEAAIQERVAAGQIVFVDVTADWCITCQVNKKVVLDREDIAERLMAPEVVLQRGDWTLPNDEIFAYLESHGRYGIPFNAVYGPGAPDGITLP